MSRTFTPKRVAGHEPKVRAIADELPSTLADDSSPDFIQGFASPFPVFVIADILGVPRDRFEWLQATSSEIAGLLELMRPFNPASMNRRFGELHDEFTQLIEDRRRAPRDDLISALANELRVDRADPKPISFGNGIHHCLGAALTRLEMRVALRPYSMPSATTPLITTPPRGNRAPPFGDLPTSVYVSEVRELPAARTCPTGFDIIYDVTDILIRDVPDEVVEALDANAKRNGQTRAEYLRRLLAGQQGAAVTREQLNRFAERTTDLTDPEVMAAAWR